MKNIGLLGGSFDPPHKGHLYISLEAKKILNLDEIWWLVTPQNPLKINLRKLLSFLWITKRGYLV